MTDDTPHPDDFALPDGDDLQAMREACGLRQRDVANAIDKSVVTVYQYESDNSRPTYDTLGKVLDFYRREWPEEAEAIA